MILKLPNSNLFFDIMLILNNFTSFLLYNVFAWLIVYYILFIYKNWRNFIFSWKHNGFFLPILPIIGNSYITLFACYLKRTPVNALSTLEWINKYSKLPFNFWNGSDYCYVTSNPEEIKTVLNHPMCYNKGNSCKMLNILIPESILLVSSEKWKIKRKFFQNSYKPAVLKPFVDTFYRQCCNLLENIDRLNNTKNLFDYLSEYSFVNFFLTSAGLEEENCLPELKKIGTTISSLQENMILRIFDPIPAIVWLYCFPSGQQCRKDKKELKKIIRNLKEQKYQQHHDREVCSSNEKAMPLFDLIVNGTNMDENETLDDITFFTMAATETTGNSLTFCFVLLGMHPEIQETLYKEVIEALGENPIVSDDLSKLKYTEAVINEALRIFPSVPTIQRYLGADINVGSQVIPKGANFTIDIFHLHRDERYWPNPLKFDPSRFLPENASKIIPYTFIPFSAGPRDCLGKAQAMTVMKTTVANVVRKVKISSSHKSVDEFLLTSFVTMKPEHPVNCQFTPRLVD